RAFIYGEGRRKMGGRWEEKEGNLKQDLSCALNPIFSLLSSASFPPCFKKPEATNKACDIFLRDNQTLTQFLPSCFPYSSTRAWP
ncbi:MAG: hypothetical protein NWS16_00115, partial [Akkermansiaceae bacterium]|nr:hypothetical protein [Akkermansiaceae bacterium]